MDWIPLQNMVFEKNSRGYVKEINCYRGDDNELMYDVREFHYDYSGHRTPTKNGVLMAIDAFKDFIEMLRRELCSRPSMDYSEERTVTYSCNNKQTAYKIASIGVIDGNPHGYRTELIIMNWGGADENKYDLRGWTPSNSPYAKKGITIRQESLMPIVDFFAREGFCH